MLKQRFTKLWQVCWLLTDVAYPKLDISTSHKEKTILNRGNRLLRNFEESEIQYLLCLYGIEHSLRFVYTVISKGPFWPLKWGQNFDPETAPF